MKRLFDVSVSSVLLVLLLPALACVALVVRITMGHPILFRQRRPGFRGKPFDMIKFRSMSAATDSEGQLLPDDVRLGRIGRMLRASSLDELPELFNVLRGEMSLVGPRPLLMQYLERYSPEQARRHEVRPGITGWAQVNGRNAISWEDKLAYDIWYVDHRTFLLDVKILAMTMLKLLRPSGISAHGSATMPEFHGTSDKIRKE